MTTLAFIDLSPEIVVLGWRFDDVIPEDVVRAIEAYLGPDFRSALFSPQRTQAIKPFSLAVEAVHWAELVDNVPFVEEASSLNEICSRINAELQSKGLRLPTEDEFEAAIGGSLFAWGDFIPEGIPYRGRNTVTMHQQLTATGLRFNHDTYSNELVDGYFKMGDGGVSLCGGEPWPMPWLCLSPSFRVPLEMCLDCLPEFLETTVLRPVRIE
jgi:hypothetical protein